MIDSMLYINNVLHCLFHAKNRNTCKIHIPAQFTIISYYHTKKKRLAKILLKICQWKQANKTRYRYDITYHDFS